MARFLLTTFGSLGDLHPYIAVGLGLRARGHQATIGTSEIYRAKIEGEGLAFHPLRPDLGFALNNPAVMRQAFHPRTGSEYVFRHMLMPHVEASFEDTLEAARNADLLVGHPIAFATPTVAEALNKPWVSVALQPAVFLSAYDPPVLAAAPALAPFQNAGPWFWKPMLALARSVTARWGGPLNSLRRRLGLRELKDPVLGDMFSPHGTHAWFSRVLATPQRDWPHRTIVTGFPFYDKLDPGVGLSAELEQFLAAGPPPVVFTLGSSATMDAGPFYEESAKAALEAGCRAVLLTGSDPRNRPARALPESICVAEYAPYSELFSRAAATVHQGGVGTTAQALQSGKPMLVVPYSHDQPDNARRVALLGAGRTVKRSAYRASLVARELRAILGDLRYAESAARVRAQMSGEDGVAAACRHLEELLY